jgi:hypothetical protein
MGIKLVRYFDFTHVLQERGKFLAVETVPPNDQHIGTLGAPNAIKFRVVENGQPYF